MKDNLLSDAAFQRAINDESSLEGVEDAIKRTNPHGFKIKSLSADNLVSPQGWKPNTLYDWGQSNHTTAIKDQGQCGSCWAFSATEQIESNHALVYSLPPPLAPQQIVDCDVLSNHCDGGFPPLAYEYVQGVGGLETESEYPYVGVKQTCNDNGPKAVNITGFRMVSLLNETGMLDFLARGGPLSVCLNANNLESYKGNNQILPGSTCNQYDIDHCVQLTGFLTDDKGNVAAWNVRNSWGTGWGNNGYGFLEFGVNACNLDLCPSIVFV